MTDDTSGFWARADWSAPRKPLTENDVRSLADKLRGPALPHTHVLSRHDVERGHGLCFGCGRWVDVR